MGEASDALNAARAAARGHRWDEARDSFRTVRAVRGLPAQDLTALADVTWWLGRVDESIESGEAAYRAHLASGQTRPAAWAAVGVAINHLLRGADALGSGWIGRAAELLADDPECSEAGYLRYLLEVESALDGPEPDAVVASARAVADLGRRLGDANLVAAGLVGEGRVLVKQCRVAEGMALLDRAMVFVVADGLAPDWVGNLYCHVIAACHEVLDIRRSAQWTEALERWLATMPAAVVFTGVCRVHRSQILQFTGEWARAHEVAEQVCAELEGVFSATAAEGHYQVGEINRLRGNDAAAEAAYARAHRLGRDPQPGLALLRLAQNRIGAAEAAVRAALLARTGQPLARAPIRAAQVDVALAAGDVATADEAAAELAETAAAFRSPGLLAGAARATGAVLLARGGPDEALPVLGEACRRWLDLAAPYECARARVLLAAAYEALGDAEAARRERDAAAEVFIRLGAVTDATALTAGRLGPTAPDRLTEREREVLSCLAAGRTNKEIAAALFISDKTVQRHLSNIFTKLGVTSRTAAAAYAFEHGLMGDPTHR